MQTLALLLFVALQQPVPAAPPPAAPPPAPPRRAAATTGTLEVHVTDRSGTPASGVRVSASGPSTREGVTDASGNVAFQAVGPGTYRLRTEGDGFVALEKELGVRAGSPARTEMALSAAPPSSSPSPAAPPAAAAPPPPPSAPPAGVRGEPRVLSLADLADRSLSGRDGVKVVPVGCTGDTSARLIVLRDALQPTAAVDESLYLMAGEATATIDATQQTLGAGWFALLPRETDFKVVKKGRNAAVFLSLLTGRPCGQGDESGR